MVKENHGIVRGVALIPKKTYCEGMKDFEKDLIIAGLVVLFALSTYVQLLGDNRAKAIEYEICLNRSLDRLEKSTGAFDRELFQSLIETDCSKYRPQL